MSRLLRTILGGAIGAAVLAVTPALAGPTTMAAPDAVALTAQTESVHWRRYHHHHYRHYHHYHRYHHHHW